jgi:hypothetical protein
MIWTVSEFVEDLICIEILIVEWDYELRVELSLQLKYSELYRQNFTLPKTNNWVSAKIPSKPFDLNTLQ